LKEAIIFIEGIREGWRKRMLL